MHDHRFKQAHREARWAFWLTLTYLVCWAVAAYLPGSSTGFTGLPRWFELACLLLPLVFIFLCALMVKYVYRDISLESDDEK